ncbi:oligoendopeptidase F [Aneurinibacillus sp. Ricciae_BoGa-3]|uniref:oligoendopeptidase F n=1 Tax=Aneurinibacillus sp. Ricciae_BoGa-3 TaxID=3022697 RepID=UPI0023404AC4|nr:oligoendopeptidase F [Aneurinibacillus sp. Ricciae_BoGa-3]WCK56827.1 oligoendopeptidase F [Aneurinibacillus sp. Ricciae_BoGa-3]
MEHTKQKTLPKRSEIPAEMKWKLEELFSTDQAWEEQFQQVNKLVDEMKEFQGRLAQSPEELASALKIYEKLGLAMERVYVYARMRRDEDNANTTYQALTDRAASLSVALSSAISFLVPEILGMPADKLNIFIKSEELKDYTFFLEEIKRQKEHVLSAEEERIIAQAGELAQAPQNIFGMINNADISFPVIKDEKGEEVQISHGRYLQLMENQDRDVRKAAFEGLYDTYKKQKNTLAATLNASVKKDVFYARVRKYPSALAAALDNDNIPVDVYTNLIKAVRDNLPAMHRYVALRKKLLGVDELHMYDLYVPMVKEVDFTVEYSKAMELVQKGLAPLGEEYIDVLKEAFASGWIDVHENEGKTSGAYSWGAYGTHPYVLLNYHNNVNNLFTLAHEMGHAMHSYYSDKNQPYLYAQYKIFVAEVASTCNESLLMDYMLKVTEDPRKKMYLLNYYLEQFRGTIYRQTMFAEFEKIIHEKVEAGEALTPETLCSIYRGLNVDYYGPDMVIDPDIDMEWSRIPHFYNEFYVYQYATGFSAATALSQQILKEGQPAVERYLSFLKSGGSDYPIELLRKAGVDMAKPEPVVQALQVFAGVLDEMEKLAEQL